MSWERGWRPYESAAQRRAKAARAMAKLRKQGVGIQPVTINGRGIARSFWGRAWCEHLEKFSDYENRLPRGRTYVRNGSVCHLDIQAGKIVAMVSGSRLYTVEIAIKPLSSRKWKGLRSRCAGQVGSLLELLQGKLAEQVMTVVTNRDDGLFPLPREIHLNCSCPDWATMCKHVAAVLYGVGARLDEKPELLFLLRGVDHQELVNEDAAKAAIGNAPATTGRRLRDEQLADLFGIDLAADEPSGRPVAKRRGAPATTKTIATKGRPSTIARQPHGRRSAKTKRSWAMKAVGRISAPTRTAVNKPMTKKTPPRKKRATARPRRKMQE